MVFNALWNYAFFESRNVLVGFLGLLAFLAPLVILQVALFVYDSMAAWTHLAYTAWVVVYDLPLFYRIWQLNSRQVGRVSG
jgi:tryptophan-rich sensory protein